MTTVYGMPLFLVDNTPDNLTDAIYTELHDRIRVRIHCTLRNADRTAIMVYVWGRTTPVASLDFGARHALGTIAFAGMEPMSMNEYLSRVGRSSQVRKFVASDGQTYTWSYKTSDNEWQCLTSRSYSAAEYTLDGEAPTVSGSLTIDESYSHIANELIVTLLIMRHIAKYNL